MSNNCLWDLSFDKLSSRDYYLSILLNKPQIGKSFIWTVWQDISFLNDLFVEEPLSND